MRTEMIPSRPITLSQEVNGYGKGAEGVLLMRLSCADREECVVRMAENGWAMYVDSSYIKENVA